MTEETYGPIKDQEENTRDIAIRSELYGHSTIAPSFQFCPSCQKDIPTPDIVWRAGNQPQCPECGTALQSTREETPAADRMVNQELESAQGVVDLARLHRLLDDDLDEEDLRTLCLYLDVDYGDLPAQGQSGKARELIGHVQRRGRIADLLQKLERYYPFVPLSNAYRKHPPDKEDS